MVMAGERWVFTPDQIEFTPSRKGGVDSEKEICYRQQGANFMQDMGQRLHVTQLCINTAIVYMHRFYMFHSFVKFHRNSMAEACLFLAAKVEEQPRKLEHVIKVAHMILHRDQGPLDIESVAYLEHAQELVVNENILLQTLGFELRVDHPHSHIVKTCNLIRAPKDLAQTSYFLATNSLHLTQMCMQYKPSFVACVCIHLACKWAQFEIPRSNEGKEWWFYVDKDMTPKILEELTQNFLAILDKCPSKFKKKLMSKSAKDEDLLSMMPKIQREPTSASTSASSSKSGPSLSNHEAKDKGLSLKSPLSKIKTEPKVVPGPDSSEPVSVKLEPKSAEVTTTTSTPTVPTPNEGLRRVKTESFLTSLTTKEYFERKEREKFEKERHKIMQAKEKQAQATSGNQGHEGDQTKISKVDKHAIASQHTRHHTNIFEQMTSEQHKADTSDPSTDTKDNVTQSKEKHSLERSLQAQQSYKDKYHEKEQPPQNRKLPFSVDVKKLRDERSGKPPSHRPSQHRSESSREPASSGRHGHDPKHPKHVLHTEHRNTEHKSHAPPPSRDRDHTRRDVHRSTGDARIKPDGVHAAAKTSIDPGSSSKAPPIQAAEKPILTEAVHKSASKIVQPVIDPEEGEILDDDSPSIPESREDVRKPYPREGDKAHGHRHHHRERRSSGHRHSPAVATAPVPHPDREQAPPTSQEVRSRHKSPRGRPAKEEQSHNPPSTVHHERKLSATRYDLPTVDAAQIGIGVAPEVETLPKKLSEELSVPDRSTPEPGEIIEQRSSAASHRHGHHKSSHSKSHKHKHRERDSANRDSATRERDSADASSGSLKIKLDLKGAGVGKIPTTPTKRSSPAVSSGEERKKEIKLKIKSQHSFELDNLPSQDTRDMILHSRQESSTSTGLKMKLKVPSSATPLTGNGDASHSKSEGKMNTSGSATKMTQSGSASKPDLVSNPIKLTISKDSLSGKYVQSSGSSSKSHRHSTSDKSSRKRPYTSSPSEGLGPQKHKLQRNDSSSKLSLNIHDITGEYSTASSGPGSPSVGTPSKDTLDDMQKKLQQLIELKQGELQRTHKKLRPANNSDTSTPPSDHPMSFAYDS